MTYCYDPNRAQAEYVAAWPDKGQVYFARLDKAAGSWHTGENQPVRGTSGMRQWSSRRGRARKAATLVGWKHNVVFCLGRFMPR